MKNFWTIVDTSDTVLLVDTNVTWHANWKPKKAARFAIETRNNTSTRQQRLKKRSVSNINRKIMLIA